MRSHASLSALLTEVLGCAVTRVTSAAAASPSLGLASSTDSLVVVTEAGSELRLFLKIRRAGARPRPGTPPSVCTGSGTQL